MAIVHTNNLVKGFSGTIGKLVFRQVQGQTIVSGKPARAVKQSQQQKDNRERFKSASAYAKSAMLNPDKKAYYWRKAKKLNLPNAYTAAIGDYMRNVNITEVDTKQYKGKPGNIIRIKAHKKDFSVAQVRITIFNSTGNIIESNLALKTDPGIFIYKATEAIARQTNLYIQITTNDTPGNTSTHKHVLTVND